MNPKVEKILDTTSEVFVYLGATAIGSGGVGIFVGNIANSSEIQHGSAWGILGGFTAIIGGGAIEMAKGVRTPGKAWKSDPPSVDRQA